MEAKEMMKKFDELYNLMSSSDKVENMELFGNVMCEMFEWFTANQPALAQEWLGKLESIKWHNYLTSKEAGAIIAEMNPEPVWKKEQWADALEKLGIPTEESPYYNANALFVTMSMVYSDSAKTIASLMGKTLEEVEAGDMLKATHALAIDKLKDADKRFDVRQYFNI